MGRTSTQWTPLYNGHYFIWCPLKRGFTVKAWCQKKYFENILLTLEDGKNTCYISKILQNKNILYELTMFASEVAPTSFHYSKQEMIT